MAITEHKTDDYHYFSEDRGRKQGEYRSWHENGQPWEHYFYVDDKRHGEYKAWHDNGQPWEHCFYVDDKRHGETKCWYGNGQPKRHCFYVDGHRQGEYRLWHENGQLIRHCFFVDDKQVINFLKSPEMYPKTSEERTWFALSYGSGQWLH